MTTSAAARRWRVAHLLASCAATLDFWEWSHDDDAELAVAEWVRERGAIGAGLFQTTERCRPGPEHAEAHPSLMPEYIGREWGAIGNLVP